MLSGFAGLSVKLRLRNASSAAYPWIDSGFVARMARSASASAAIATASSASKSPALYVSQPMRPRAWDKAADAALNASEAYAAKPRTGKIGPISTEVVAGVLEIKSVMILSPRAYGQGGLIVPGDAPSRHDSHGGIRMAMAAPWAEGLKLSH